MKKMLLFLTLLIEIPCMADAYAYLRKISYDAQATKAAGKTPFKITMQSSDASGQVVKQDGSKGSIQNVVFDFDDLSSFSFTIPWESWDGDKTVHVKVQRGNELISQIDLQDRNRAIKVIGVKNAKTETISKTRNRAICNMHYDFTRERNVDKCTNKDIDCSLNIELTVDPISGSISVSKANAFECDDADQHDRIHES